MSQTNNYETTAELTREDAIKEYNTVLSRNQGYYKAMEAYSRKLAPLVGGSPFSFEGWKKIISSDSIYNTAKNELSKMFAKDPSRQKSFERYLDNTRDIQYRADIIGDAKTLEGWGGGAAVYASSTGAFAMGSTPFIIGGWLAAARSQEMFLNIDNQNSTRLEFEFNVDYLQIGDQKYFFPKAFRGGEIVGYNKLPKVDWITPNTKNGVYTQPEQWCGNDMFIELPTVPNANSLSVKGNFLEVSGRNKHKFGIEPNCRFSAIKYTNGGATVTQKLNMHYDIATGETNLRYFKASTALKNVEGFSAPVVVNIWMKLNLDDGDFTLAVICDTAAEAAIIKGIQFDGKVSNIANELTNIPTAGVDKYQFIRECEYRNYSKVSLNEYMADNFRIGSNNNITYAAYATDKNLQYTLFNRELEAENFVYDEVLADTVDIDSFALTRKIGGFINNNLSFNINRFAPGLGLQDYKFGLKDYLTKVLETSETDLNVPASVKRQWILMGYSPLISEFPEIKFENAAFNLDVKEEGASANENFGFAVDTRCGFIDSLGRGVRLIANNDSRWRDRGNDIIGVMRTYSMEYPFLVYYPHAIRMYTAIDADMPNRTAIYIGGREFRGVFAAAAIKLELNGVLDSTGEVVNKFEGQMTQAKSGYFVTHND